MKPTSNPAPEVPPLFMRRRPVFSRDAYRLMFFAGAVQLLATLLFWSAELAGRLLAGWTPLHTVIPATWAHLFLMSYTLFPFFIFGFLMTTLPRWLDGVAIPPHRHLTAFALLAGGVVLFYAGLFFSKTVLTAGVTLLLAGWGAAIRALFIVYLGAKTADKHSAAIIQIALAAGWVGLLCHLLWLLTGQIDWLKVSMQMSVWLFLVPVLVAISQRIVPRLSSRLLERDVAAARNWLLPAVLGGGALHVVLALAELPRWLFVADLPLAAVAFYHALRWQIFSAFKLRSLAVLHIAWLWWGIAMLLFAVQSLTLLLVDQPILGTAPVHALGIGFATTLTLALATRVTLRYAGGSRRLDGVAWACFLGISVTAVLRIAAEFPVLTGHVGVSFNLLAALAWLVVLGAWGIKFAPHYFRQQAEA
ncbi:MAG: NnrS family protein [Gammaproteobacteria bacterium]